MIRAFVLPLLFLAVASWGQDTSIIYLPGPPPMALPDWLAPLPQASEQSLKASITEVTSVYSTPALPDAVVAHYQQQIASAGVSFETKRDGIGMAIELTAEKTSGVIFVKREGTGSRVEVNYGVKRDRPARPVQRDLPVLRAEWPEWLEVPGGRLLSQRTNPRGRIVQSSVETCPGDVIGKPSRGCINQTYDSSQNIKDVYSFLESLLAQHGYTSEGQRGEPAANQALWKSLGDAFGSLTEREYPVPTEPGYYRQINVFLRQMPEGTKAEITFMVANPRAESGLDISGGWDFTHFDGQFQGRITLRQSGPQVTGTWHTSKGKSEPDTPVSGYIDGHTVVLARSIGGSQQNYVLTLSKDANRLDGFGDGWFLNHTNLNMQRSVAGTSPTVTAAPRQTWMGIAVPPERGTWKWAMQSVAQRRGSEVTYSSFYYEAATGRSVDHPLSLPAGATIVGVFPDDCTFSVKEDSGQSFTYRNGDEAKSKQLGPGTWNVYPLKCGGIALFLK